MTDSLTISPEALSQASSLSLTEEALRSMVARSTPFSNPRGNRRFEGFMFVVKDRVLLSVDRIDTDPVRVRAHERVRAWRERNEAASTDEAQIVSRQGPRRY